MDEINYNQIFGLDEGSGNAGDGQPPESSGGGQNANARGGSVENGDNPGGAGKPASTDTGSGEAGKGNNAGGENEKTPPKVDVTGNHGANGNAGRGNAGRDEGALSDSVIRGLGITDPYTGKPVTTKAEYDAYRERVYQERRSFLRERTGMSDTEIDDFISMDPKVRRAAEDGERAREIMESERQRHARERVDAEVRKISAMDPGVKSIADLTSGEKYPEMLELVKRGYDLSDAWKLANFDRLQGMAQAASRQAAINSGAGRSGFQVTRSQGAGNDTVSVPKDVLEMYRALNPEMTDAEIRADYNKFAKMNK